MARTSWQEPDEREPIYNPYRPPISKLDWYGASIDLEHGWLILASGEIVRGEVEINADDLRLWLIQRDAEKIEPRQRRSALPVREIADLDPSNSKQPRGR